MTTSAVHIRTGAMRHRAALQAKTSTPDGGGGASVSWSTERELWCQIRPLSGSERLRHMALKSEVSHEIYARYATDISAGKRILYGSTVYNIRAVFSPENRGEFVHIVAEEGVGS